MVCPTNPPANMAMVFAGRIATENLYEVYEMFWPGYIWSVRAAY